MDKLTAKQQIQNLVEKYQRIAEAGKIKSYNEAQTRNEFIEPLFEFLGWDMRNLTTDNEVTTEENVSGGRVDLSFRLRNIPVFFLEAKAMKVDLDEWKWAEQAINYSWNKSVTWAILTDFESIKIFNAEIPPKSISQNLFIEINCQDFINRFDQLWLLSKESFEQKALYKEAQKWGKLTVRKQVGEKLFEDLMSWRILLTNDFKKQNNLTDEELDEGVQRILDRLIFIRTAEDRKIEPNVLLGILRGGKANLYKQLAKVFRDFDDSFNSKLFAQHYCEEWKASDEVISEVIKGLYETKDGYRYDFSVISADVLGGIYEQYLSFVQVRKGEDKTKSKRKSQGIYYTPKYIVEFIVKETLGEVLKKTKPKELAKIKVLDPACGSGSFLNAAYDKILETITKQNPQTSLFAKFDILKDNIFGVDLDAQAVEIAQLNLLLKVLSQKAKLPTLQHNLRVGNSLVSGNSEKLEKYFGETWQEQKPFNFAEEFKEVFQKKTSKFHLLTFETKYSRQKNSDKNIESIVLSDEEKILVAECIAESVKNLGIKLLAVSILPDHVHLVIADMGKNIEEIVNHIKGYSTFIVNRTLKGSVAGEGQQQHLWSKGYSDTFLDDETHLFNSIEYVKNNHLKHAESWGKIDIVKVQSILKPVLYDMNNFHWKDFEYIEGGFDVIIGNPPYVRQENIKQFKDYFKEEYKNVYAGTADLLIYFFEKSMKLLKDNGYFGFIVSNKFIKANYGANLRKYLKENFKIIHLVDNFKKKVFEDASVDPCIIIIQKVKPKKDHQIIYNDNIKVLQSSLDEKGWNFADSSVLDLKKKIEAKGKKIKDWEGVTIYIGIISGLNEAFIIDENLKNKLIADDSNSSELIKPILRGRDISKYEINYQKLYLIDCRIGVDLTEYKAIYRHLEQFKNKLLKRIDYKKDLMEWYNLRPCVYYDEFEKPKIIYPDISEEGGFYWDNEGYYFNNTVYMIVGNVKKAWVAILNSKLMNWYYRQIASGLGSKGVRYFTQFMKEMPIIEDSQKLESFAQTMLDLNKELQAISANTDKHNSLKRNIEKLDREIDDAIYKLYGLTNEEIKTIEQK